MSKFNSRLAATVMLLMASGCTEILNTHSSGSGPEGPGAIPGAPGGDSVSATGPVIFNSGNIQLPANGTSPILVDLIVGGHPHDTSEYAISFSGVKLTITDTPVIAIDALNAVGQQACGLEISGGEFRLVSGAGAPAIGTYTGAADEHRVFLRVDLASARCFVRIEQVAQGTDGPPVQPVIVGDGPVIAAAFGELDRLRIAWEETSPGDATNYFLGPVVISKRN
ncbi:hypothetical protein [Pelagibius sp. Alg239-R121]|uniref:hypothetical protein n=1 Tax=Pelagibius sp. Alg239-R121 TaxID=2993448 RepID=UPI0024A674EC|nr:hypothetical protein [Pelagibius sp. Alg239-R121]